jgi:hypothetical protein
MKSATLLAMIAGTASAVLNAARRKIAARDSRNRRIPGLCFVDSTI